MSNPTREFRRGKPPRRINVSVSKVHAQIAHRGWLGVSIAATAVAWMLTVAAISGHSDLTKVSSTLRHSDANEVAPAPPSSPTAVQPAAGNSTPDVVPTAGAVISVAPTKAGESPLPVGATTAGHGAPPAATSAIAAPPYLEPANPPRPDPTAPPIPTSTAPASSPHAESGDD